MQIHSNHSVPTFFHPLDLPESLLPLPELFTYPFHYTPHPICLLAAEQVKKYIERQNQWKEELQKGKMFGVLIVKDTQYGIGFLAAFSGTLGHQYCHPFFVPPIYDLLSPDSFFPEEEQKISRINDQIKEIENSTLFLQQKAKIKTLQQQALISLQEAQQKNQTAKAIRDKKRIQGITIQEEELLIRESQFQKAELKRIKQHWKETLAQEQSVLDCMKTRIEALKQERQSRSSQLQMQLFQEFHILNGRGETRNLCELFFDTPQQVPPSGSGECAAPKLLQAAYRSHLTPIAIAEFWWGESPKTEIREHGHFYPACKGKCGPILKFMLQGLNVAPNPMVQSNYIEEELDIVYEDDYLLVVNKPAGLLSAPGKISSDSIYQRIQKKYPNASGPLLVHRLDMSTSGLLLVAKNKTVHQNLQAQFKNRTVKKRYIALLEGIPAHHEGIINLPLRPDPLNRPYQIVDREKGKPAITHYQVIEHNQNQTRIIFFPHTGRTHQLRVHAAHISGLHCPIVGDELYGHKAERLFLHAEYLEFSHPVFHKTIQVEKHADF